MNPRLTLVRQESEGGETRGTLYFEDTALAKTLERPWMNNAPYISCVPTGIYGLVQHSSPKFGDTYALVNTDLGVTKQQEDYSKRYAILIHPANFVHELQGCIALGTGFGIIGKRSAIFNSRKTFGEIHDFILENGIKELEIKSE